MKTSKGDKFLWAIFIVIGLVIVYAMYDGAQRAAECRERGGVAIYQGRSAYPTCFDPAVLK